MGSSHTGLGAAKRPAPESLPAQAAALNRYFSLNFRFLSNRAAFPALYRFNSPRFTQLNGSFPFSTFTTSSATFLCRVVIAVSLYHAQ